MRNITYTIILLVLIGCKSDFEKLQGQWRRITPDNTRYQTLDINDSIVILNKLDRNGFYLREKIYTKNDTIILPLAYEFLYNLYVGFNNDTLILYPLKKSGSDWIGASKWVKMSDESNEISADFNSNLMFSINLDTNNKSIPFDTIGYKNKWTIINIGYPKKSIKRILNLHKDSLYLNINGNILTYNDINDILKFELEETTYPNKEIQTQEDLIFIINADKNTPDEILDSILIKTQDLDFIKGIYRTCVNNDRKTVGLNKLR